MEPKVVEPTAPAPLPPVRGPTPARVAPPPAPAAEPFEIALQPVRIELGEREIHIELELLIGNRTDSTAEAIRLSAAVVSASPRQDMDIAGFQAASQLAPSAPPFDLPPGGAGRMPMRLSLARELVHVVELGGRPMFVPIVAVDLRWRGGLSIRRFGMSFMIGTAGQSGRPGPIWLNRGQPRGPLTATRYVAKAPGAS
ncbi:hypothetical protein [Sphingomonas sp.]|uniref:hypothetical protein n=1 Tax=Sphingomonas sp. TaxID=28214 RepID=UPI002EDBA28F